MRTVPNGTAHIAYYDSSAPPMRASSVPIFRVFDNRNWTEGAYRWVVAKAF